MTLDEWMKAAGLDDVTLGAKVGRDRSQIYRIRKLGQKPSLGLALEIEKLSDGSIRIETWFPELADRAA